MAYLARQVTTVKDFGQVFDSYQEFEEMMLEAKMEATTKAPDLATRRLPATLYDPSGSLMHMGAAPVGGRRHQRRKGRRQNRHRPSPLRRRVLAG